jgi:hypothetical protein
MKKKGWSDPILDELRGIRDEHAAEFNYDVMAMGRDLQEQERKSGRTYTSMPPKRLEPQATNGKPNDSE